MAGTSPAMTAVRQCVSPFIPAQAGIQRAVAVPRNFAWVPAFAGTNGKLERVRQTIA